MNVAKGLIALTAALTIAACANKYEEPAKQAVANAEAKLAEIREDAQKFASDELKDAEESLARLKARVNDKEYKDVVGDAATFDQKITAAKDMIVAQQTQVAAATREWTDNLSKEVPPKIEAIEKRLAALKPNRLPKDVTKEAYDNAKASVDWLKAEWTAASAAQAEGRAIEAADKARAVAAKADEVSQQLAIAPKA
jgi:hypothetical protein